MENDKDINEFVKELLAVTNMAESAKQKIMSFDLSTEDGRKEYEEFMESVDYI